MKDKLTKKQFIKFTATKEDDDLLIVDLIAKKSDLSKSIIKKLMVYGAVFLTIKNKRKAVRKAKSILKSGNLVECYYDPLLNLDLKFEFTNLYETKYYGIYYKPAGALTEGDHFGDKISLFRHVILKKKFAYIVNRLDQETSGLIIMAYDSKTQNLFQEMLRSKVTKKYQAIVKGELKGSGVLDTKLNNKETETRFKSIKNEEDKSYLEIDLITQRKHQIRIHLSKEGYPIIGDTKYKGPESNSLKLLAYSLEFNDPYSQKKVLVQLPSKQLLF